MARSRLSGTGRVGSSYPGRGSATESGLVPLSNKEPVWGGDLHQVNWQLLQICPSCSKSLPGARSSALPTAASHPVVTTLSLPEATNGSLWDSWSPPSPWLCLCPCSAQHLAPPPPSIDADGPCPFFSLLLGSPDLGNKGQVPILRSFGASWLRIWVSSASHCASGVLSSHLDSGSEQYKLCQNSPSSS